MTEIHAKNFFNRAESASVKVQIETLKIEENLYQRTL